jgi:integrase
VKYSGVFRAVVRVPGAKAIPRQTKAGMRVYYYCRRTGAALGTEPGEARARLAEIQAAATRPHALDAATLGGLIAAFYRDERFTRLKPKTRADYRWHLEAIRERFGDLPVRGIDEAWIDRLKAKGAAKPFRTNARIARLRRLFAFAVRAGYAKSNPAAKPEMLRTRPRRILWSEAAERKFLSAKREVLLGGNPKMLKSAMRTRTEPLPPMIRRAYLVAVYTAQRLADVLAMRWEQYQTKGARAWLRVRQAKTDAVVNIPVHRTLRRELETTPKDRRAGPIITTATGRAWRQKAFFVRWRAWIKAAGLDGLQFRDLRRTAMVRLAEAGANPIQIAAISGHSIDYCQGILETYIPRNQLMGEAAINLLEAHQADDEPPSSPRRRHPAKTVPAKAAQRR